MLTQKIYCLLVFCKLSTYLFKPNFYTSDFLTHANRTSRLHIVKFESSENVLFRPILRYDAEIGLSEMSGRKKGKFISHPRKLCFERDKPTKIRRCFVETWCFMATFLCRCAFFHMFTWEVALKDKNNCFPTVVKKFQWKKLWLEWIKITKLPSRLA